MWRHVYSVVCFLSVLDHRSCNDQLPDGIRQSSYEDPIVEKMTIGESFSIACLTHDSGSGFDKDNLIFNWYEYPFEHLLSQSSYMIQDDKLYIYNVTKHHGNWVVYCSVSNGFQSAKTYFKLVVDGDYDGMSAGESNNLPNSGMPQFVVDKFEGKITHEPYKFSEHFSRDLLILSCSVLSKASIEWQKDGLQIYSGKFLKNDAKNYQLKFLQLLKSESGNYTCFMRNSYGVVSRTFDITVAASSREQTRKLQVRPSNLTVNYGGFAKFVCEVSKDESNSQYFSTKLFWMKKVGSEMQHKIDPTDWLTTGGSNYQILRYPYLNESETHATLTIKYEHVSYDNAGLYICVWHVNAGTLHEYAVLNVSAYKRTPAERNVSAGLNSHYLAIMIGIPVGGLVLVVIGMLLYCNCKKRAPPSPNRQPDPKQRIALASSNCSYDRMAITANPLDKRTGPVLNGNVHACGDGFPGTNLYSSKHYYSSQCDC